MRGITLVLSLVLILNAKTQGNQMQSVVDRFVKIALSDTVDSRTRVEALDWLGHSGNEKAISILISASYNENWDVRKQAIISLKYYDYENVHIRLTELSQDSDPKNQIIGTETLYLAYQEGNLNILVQFLNHEDAKIRLLAAQSFWYITDTEYIGILRRAYENETDPEVKRKLNSTILIRE
jgi:HEAT repeat protein